MGSGQVSKMVATGGFVGTRTTSNTTNHNLFMITIALHMAKTDITSLPGVFKVDGDLCGHRAGPHIQYPWIFFLHFCCWFPGHGDKAG